MTQPDNCGQLRQVSCGQCDGGTCGAGHVPNVCARPCAETDAQLCARYGLSIGRISANDCCGLARQVTCGVGTAAERMAFVLPPLPAGPAIRCWGGSLPWQLGGTWQADPNLIFDGQVHVRLQSLGSTMLGCLTGPTPYPLTLASDGCFMSCAADGGVVSCSAGIPRVDVSVTPTTATADIDALRSGRFVLRCQGTGPYP